MREESLEALASECAAAGFNLDAIKVHRERINAYLKTGSNPAFPLIDTCRLENKGIFTSNIPGSHQTAAEFVAFVPAAGAASRYQTSLAEIARQRNETPVMAPKALLPAVAEGHTFLCLKQMEHRSIGPFASQVFVAPINESRNFMAEINKNALPGDSTAQLLEQGVPLSTLRFTASGKVLVEDSGPSSVPAGHGSLLELLPEIKRPESAHSIFIRNIDNVCGTRAPAVNATRQFLATHSAALNLLRSLRTLLGTGDIAHAARSASSLVELYGHSIQGTTLDDTGLIGSAFSLLFGDVDDATSVSRTWSTTELVQLANRPLVSMGMVPNLGKDVGGTPVIATTPIGRTKLCIELPHVSSSDRESWLSSAKVCSHFNPVFIAVEAPRSSNPYASFSHPFWIVAEKTYMDRKVFYHESLMSEILGNSLLSNCVFVAIPRLLFTPHKTAQDALGRRIDEWIE